MTINFLDGTVSRPYYLGRRLTINPYGGLRAAWIAQNLKVKAVVVNFGGINPFVNPMVSHNESNSWGLGPRAGIGMNWLISPKFRAEGNLGASLLFTQFTSIKHKEDAITMLSSTPVYRAHIDDFNCVRPFLEAGLGLGWGTYFKRQRYHVDVAASYDFNYLWSQNMMRKLFDEQWGGTDASAGDLYMHGLTVTARFDF